MNLTEYNNKLKSSKIAILGLGVSNIPLLEYLHNLGCDVVVFNTKPLDKNLIDKLNTYKIKYYNKENAFDYRYFVEPDLPPFYVSDEWIEKIKKSMPLLPDEYRVKLLNDLHVNEYNTNILIENKQLLKLFEKLSNDTEDFNNVANWLLGPIKGYLNEFKLSIDIVDGKITEIKKLIKLVEDKKLSHTVATQNILPEILENDNVDPFTLAQKLNLLQNTNEECIIPVVKEVIAAYPDKVEKYKTGKKGLLGFFVGEVIKKISNADPTIVNFFVKQMLDE